MSANTDPNSKTDNLANEDCRPVACSASELLRAEAERLGGVRTRKPIESDLRWAYSVAAAFLDCKSDPAMIHRWQEIPRHNVEGHRPDDDKT